MKKLLEIINQHFLFLLEEKGFRITDSKSSGDYSAVITMSSGSFFIKLVLEYDSVFMDIGYASDHEAKCDSFWVRKMIGEFPKEEENKLPSVHAGLLRDHFEEIASLFSKNNYMDTLKKAKELYNARWS